GNTVTFEVKLFEGSNTVEFQYKEIKSKTTSWNGTSAGFTNGIESRDYTNYANPHPGLSGVYGIKVNHGSMNSGVLPPFPSAVTFTRAVTVKVESTYQKPDGSTLGVTTNVGTQAL